MTKLCYSVLSFRISWSDHLGGYLLSSTSVEKDLGSLITSDFKTMPDTIKKVSSATKMMWSIRRAFQSITPILFKKIFSSYIRPILEFGLPSSFPMSKGEAVLIEQVQRRGSRCILGYKDFNYSERLKRMNLFSLEYRRLRGDLIYTRRIILGELGFELSRYFNLKHDSITRGHHLKLFKTRRKHIRQEVTLSTRVVNCWNNLPKEVINAQSEEVFKKLLDEHLTKVKEVFYSHQDYFPLGDGGHQ